MYLKSLEIQGFKSFANKIKLDFHNGITGIVGPNGSGKSNVADAVRWVLGEQRTKQLRGSSMQDVIFAGTQMRNPLGFAYVAITLDNSDHSLAIDFDEVTVSRRLYRSGESEYRINGALCRLKDINELFYDTGIGKEGYSIIGQGQIDLILSSKPEDRRNLFDEAAGIVKFKIRKDAAIRKLESEKANLLRLTDILSELEKQIIPLEKQSETAKIYLKDREELKKLDANLFLVESTQQRKDLAETKENLDIAIKGLEDSENNLEESKRLYDEVSSAIKELDDFISEETRRMTESSVMKEKLEGQIALLNEQIRSALANGEHFNVRKESLESEIKEISEELSQRINSRDKIDAELSSFEEEHSGAASEHESISRGIDEINSEIEALNAQALSYLEIRSQLRSRLAALDTRSEAVRIRKSELTGKLLNVKSDSKLQEESIAALRKKFEDVTKEISDLNASQKSAEEELSGIKGKLTGIDEKLRKAQQDYHLAKSRLDALVNIAERYEGYGMSVKKVMERRGEISGIEGVVADLIRTKPEYETAIEIALGGSIQNIVTDTSDTAKKIIEILKKNKEGRATFLPLESLGRNRDFEPKSALNERGVVGVASELVTTDPKYGDVAKSLLGRILVTETIDDAVAINRKYNHSLRIVTLQGELLAPGGSISGGAFKNQSNLLGRRREIDALNVQVKEFERLQLGFQEEIKNVKSRRNELRMEIDRARLVLQQRIIEQNTARISVEREEEKQKEAEISAVSIKKENEELDLQLINIDNERKDVDSELEEARKAEEAAHAQVEKAQKKLKELQEMEQEAQKKVNANSLEAEKIRQRRSFEQENIERINEELKQRRDSLSEVENSLEINTANLAIFRADVEKVTLTIRESADSTDESKSLLTKKRIEKDELGTKQQEYFKQINDMSEQITGMNKEVSRLEAMKTRFSDAIENKINYMWEEYEITLSDAERMKDDSLEDISSMKKSIGALKEAIKKLGNVNVGAIEEYRSVKERYEFMHAQYEDIVKAEEQLKGIIAELDRSMREQFTEQFARIAESFNLVFREMFGGGKGELELMEGEDVLDAGIRIIAQPPGKKLQNMMQLSGGEKALTAIALLFAIQKLKPSPFCLLDEIEAALDESNVIRFAGYLHKLKDTQFIVITHRRGTMEASDRLYGITMQEKGISTLVSVNLIDKELSD